MERHQPLTEEGVIKSANSIDLKKKRIAKSLSKFYGRENTQKIIKEAVRIQEKEVGVEHWNKDFLIRMGKLGLITKFMINIFWKTLKILVESC